MNKPLALLCSLLVGCFRGFGDVQPEAASAPVAHLEIGDPNGARWDPSDCPRNPRLQLRFEQTPKLDASTHLFLLRGAASEELVADLRSSKRQAATDARLVALQLSEQATARVTVEASPSAPLSAGGRYTLLWVEPSAQLTFPLVVSDSPAAGAALRQSLPAALETGVAPNLQRVLLRFDGLVIGDVAREVQLRDAQDRVVLAHVTRLPCEGLGLGSGDCVQLAPADLLAARAKYRVVFGATLSDATGAPLAARDFTFETASEHDERAPRWSMLDCMKDETRVASLCVRASERQVFIRARTDENGLLELAHPPLVTAAISAAGDYALEAVVESALPALLVVSDGAGNRSELPLQLTPARDLATLSIDEVRVDPLGPEPAQEYVELLNFGTLPVPLMGLTLTTDPYKDGLRINSDVVLAAGERALLVAPDFDAQERSDGEPPSAARLVRLPGSMALKNDGAALYLRDNTGRRLSAAPALTPGQAGRCIARTSADPRRGELDAFEATHCTPATASEPLP